MRTLEEMRKIYNKAYYRDYEFEDLLFSVNDTKQLEDFADKLINSWYKAAEKYFDKLNKESRHWKREGFNSKDDYREYLTNRYPYNYSKLDYLDSDLADIDSRIDFICGQIMNYDYYLGY